MSKLKTPEPLPRQAGLAQFKFIFFTNLRASLESYCGSRRVSGRDGFAKAMAMAMDGYGVREVALSLLTAQAGGREKRGFKRDATDAAAAAVSSGRSEVVRWQ